MLLSSFGFLKREFIGSNQMGRPLEARNNTNIMNIRHLPNREQQQQQKDMIVNHQTGKLQTF